MKNLFNPIAITILIIILSISIYIIMENTGLNVEDEENMFKMEGTIKYIGLEGGFYGIIGDDGKKYQPINLPDEYRVDGLRVWFKARAREDLATIYMWGTPIEIIEIYPV